MPMLKDSTLTLYGQVSAEALPDSASFSAKDVRDALDAHGDGDLTVNLNSPGGHALEGLAIFNALKNHKGKITMNIDAIAASAASLIAMAGDDIVMRDGALMMVHDPRTFTGGTSSDLRNSAAQLDMLSSQFRSIYAKRTGRSENEIGKLLAAETWMDADQAIADGFANRKSEGEQAPIFASFDYRKYRNAPHFLEQHKGPITMSTTDLDDKTDDKTTLKPWAARFFMSAAQSKVPIADLNEIVASAETFDKAKAALIDKMAVVNNANLPGLSGGAQYGGHTFNNPAFLAKAVEGVLYAKMSGKAPEGPARELMGHSVLDLGAKLLQARGEQVSWASRDSLATAVMSGGEHSTSDFPNLLTSSGHRVLLDAYKAAECPLRTLAKVRTATDFRPLNALRLSETPALLEKPEGAEIEYGTRSETKESFGLKTFARIFALTREALINDDLGAFSDSARAWGKGAAEVEAVQLVSMFTANTGNGTNLGDGNPLYTTARGNKANAGGAINVTTLDAARQAMRSMKGLDGKTPINATPKHLVVGPAKETEAQQFLAALQAQQASNVNPFAGTLSLHVEPRFTGNAWRVFADPGDLATIAVAYLAGAQGPLLARREGWTTLGMEFRAVLDYGSGLEDWRGTYLNPGN